MKHSSKEQLRSLAAVHLVWRTCESQKTQHFLRLEAQCKLSFFSRKFEEIFKSNTSLSLWHILFHAKQNPKRPY